MNKKIKIMLVCLLSTSCLSVFSPANFSLLTVKAHAESATYSLADRGELKSLDVQSTDGKSLQLCDYYDGHKIDLTDEKTYYVTLNGKSDGLKVLAQSAGDDYIVKVFESDRKYATPHDVGENISIEKGKSTLYIRTFTSKEAFERAVDNEDVTNCDKTYKVNVNKSDTDGTDDIYLKQLTLDSENIPIAFDRDTLSYNISVKEDIDDIIIKAEPEDEDYSVKINDFKVNNDNNYKKDLHLQMGKNEIKINITDDDIKFRTYTLNINRGAAASTNTGNTGNVVTSVPSTVNSKTGKINEWVQVNSKWQYNDSTGNAIKNNWFFDRNYGKNYYLQADGNMATGWISNSGKWYYLGTDGAMKISSWILDGNKYYYLYSDGSMASNTIIGGYKLGADGAWVR